MSDLKKCKHPACNCHSAETYCSDSCEMAADTLELACNCGHPGCKDAMAPREEQ